MSQLLIFTESEVLEAQQLAAKGLQRLRDISFTIPTVFYFLASCGAHSALVEVKTSPVLSIGQRHPLFDVFVRYWPCCNTPQAELFIEQIQLVYNTCILPIRLTINDDCCQRIPGKYSPQSCHDVKPWVGEWLTRWRIAPAEIGAIWGENVTFSSPLAQPSALTSKNSRKRKRENGNDGERERIAKDLIEKVLDGMQRIQTRVDDERQRTRRKISFDPFAVVSKSQQLVSEDIQTIRNEIRTIISDNRRDEEKVINNLLSAPLDRLASTFSQSATSTREESKIQAWVKEYFRDCIHQYLYCLGLRPRDRSNFAVIIHRIVNRLFPVEKLRAFTIINGLAEHGHNLHNACRANKTDQSVIIDMVVDGLRGRLNSLPGEWMVPLPAAWLSSLMEVSYERACAALECPELAQLQLQPQGTWVPDHPDGSPLEMGYQISFLERRLAQTVLANAPSQERDMHSPQSDKPRVRASVVPAYERIANNTAVSQFPASTATGEPSTRVTDSTSSATWDGLSQSAPTYFTELDLAILRFDQLLPTQPGHMGFPQGYSPLPSSFTGVAASAALQFDPLSPSQLDYMGYPPDSLLPSMSSVDLAPNQAGDDGSSLPPYLSYQLPSPTHGSTSY